MLAISAKSIQQGNGEIKTILEGKALPNDPLINVIDASEYQNLIDICQDYILSLSDSDKSKKVQETILGHLKSVAELEAYGVHVLVLQEQSDNEKKSHRFYGTGGFRTLVSDQGFREKMACHLSGTATNGSLEFSFFLNRYLY